MYSVLAKFTSLLNASKLEKKLECESICSYLAKIGITVENLCSNTKKYKSFWTPKRKQDDAGCWERPARPLQ